MPLTLASERTKHQPSVKLGRILVVEDEGLIAETIALALKDEGYDVVTATDGRAALEIVHQLKELESNGGSGVTSTLPHQLWGRSLDLIILDLMLPYINGLDLCRLIRREGMTVPILMLSAKGSETDRVVGLEVGADDYLTKPFGIRELVARCRALLRRYQQFQVQPEQPSLKYQDIALYPQECRITVRGAAVNFSPKEFKILELFMSYPRRVWSREQLLERIWGPDFIGDSKTVDVHIRWLREKLEVDPSSPIYLVTVRGFGYRFG
ncbi:response regulator transcription factor [Phormidium sp. FACHB-592]|uniref:Response regulator transcription factor n=1 Tax=Stenomitos frigidus AS-A4 TaxID=2933935 RepID=A0ABV0KMM1_9CYAN|nr:response regulator transcription factor [Phormidium sp. FACHB-592]MBD2076909.1 response regulator transcription factor [Phormidium sp. FACHB-592]